MVTRVVAGSARVLREIRAAAPLMAALRAPIPARAPWLTSVVRVEAACGRRQRRPVAVLVEPDLLAGPAAAAFLAVRPGSMYRGTARTVVTLLGQESAPQPGGRPPARLYARDDGAAEQLADGIRGVLRGLRGPWELRLAGLPLGCPTTKALAAMLPTAAFRSDRSLGLVDDLDGPAGPAHRSTDPRALDAALPALLGRLPAGRPRTFLRSTARLHAAIGALELATVGRPDAPGAALLTLLDGDDRWPWWGFAGLSTRMGAPLVSLSASGGGWRERRVVVERRRVIAEFIGRRSGSAG